MRRIVSKFEEEKKRQKNLRIISAILIFVMFGSVFGIVVNSFIGTNNKSGNLKYNGYEFIQQEGLWYLTYNGANFVFLYSPEETEDISTYVRPLSSYSNLPLYISSEDKSAEIEIYRNFQNIAQRMQPACINEKNCDDNLPIKTCSNNFIIIQESDKKEIVQSGNCVYIKGPKEKLDAITDEFLFKILNIK